jgi:hypothetical protein
MSFIFDENGLEVFLVLDYYLTANLLDELHMRAAAFEGTENVFGDPRFEELMRSYSVAEILSGYGRPSSALVAAFPTREGDAPRDYEPFSLVLFYPDEGFLAEYISPVESIGDQFVACPQGARVEVVAWGRGRRPTLEEAVQRKSGDGIHKLNFDYFRTIETATEMDMQTFIEVFSDPLNGSCITTPKSLWMFQ